MANQTIQIRRGTNGQLNSTILGLAELGWCTDTKQLWVGDGLSNKCISAQTGIIDIPFNSNTISVIFNSSFPNIMYSLGISLVNIVDSSPTCYSHIVTNKSTTGFTIKLSSLTDSENYKLEYIVK